MRSIEEFLNENSKNNYWDSVNTVLKQTGWPKLEEDDGKMVSWDEDTKITFELDEDNGLPYISKIECNFVNLNPAHSRDLNGLVDLYDKLWRNHVKLMK